MKEFTTETQRALRKRRRGFTPSVPSGQAPRRKDRKGNARREEWHASLRYEASDRQAPDRDDTDSRGSEENEEEKNGRGRK